MLERLSLANTFHAFLPVSFSSRQPDGLAVAGKKHRSKGPHPGGCTALNRPPVSLALLTALEKSIPPQLKEENKLVKSLVFTGNYRHLEMSQN